jgi:hypothetical protein
MVSFRSAQGEVNKGIDYIDLDLSVARDRKRLGISGNFIYVPVQAFDAPEVVSNTLDSGIAFMRPNRQSGSPIILAPGQIYSLEPFDEVYISNQVQSGKMMRVYFSTGQIVEPAAGTITTVESNPGVEREIRKLQTFDEIIDKRAFFGGSSTDPNSSQLSAVDLKNPSGSGVYVDVQGVRIASGQGFSLRGYYCDADPSGGFDTTFNLPVLNIDNNPLDESKAQYSDLVSDQLTDLTDGGFRKFIDSFQTADAPISREFLTRIQPGFSIRFICEKTGQGINVEFKVTETPIP